MGNKVKSSQRGIGERGERWYISFNDETDCSRRRLARIFEWLCIEARSAEPRIPLNFEYEWELEAILRQIRSETDLDKKGSCPDLLGYILTSDDDYPVRTIGLPYIRMVNCAVAHASQHAGRPMSLSYAIAYLGDQLRVQRAAFLRFRRGREYISLSTTRLGAERFGASFEAELVRIAGSRPHGPKGFLAPG